MSALVVRRVHLAYQALERSIGGVPSARGRGRGAVWLAVWLALALPAHGQQWRIADPNQGPVPLPAGGTGARELSGITWAGAARYYAVSDKLHTVFPLTIEIDPADGTIRRAALEPGVLLPGSSDLEGVAYDARTKTLLVSDESGPGIRAYRAADGRLVRTVALPPVFRSARKNLSLESLALAPDDRSLWTANEETLKVDGPRATFETGSVIRLQRFDAQFRPAGQWAYRTEPLFGDLLLRGRDVEISGVADLVALPGGVLLVLERAYGSGGARIGLYEVDLAGATDVGALASLAHATYVPVRKTLLWQRLFPQINIEGAALGPALADGARSLVLISDDGQHLQQALYALTVRPRR